MTGESDDPKPKFRRGVEAMKEAIEREEIGTKLEAVQLEHERGQHRSLEWVEEKSREAISLAQNEQISASDALHLIAAVVGYEEDQN